MPKKIITEQEKIFNPQKKKTCNIDYVILESCNGQIELHRGRGGYAWKGQKGKKLEWILPIKVETNADEILKTIYSLPEWSGVGKGKECSIDSKELRSAIWHKIFPLIAIKHLPTINEKGNLSDLERMNKTRTKRRYNDDEDMITIESDECYTFYEDVDTIVKHFGADYWKGKTVYMNCDDAGQSAFWIYFYNNFKTLKIKQIISTHYDGSKLDFSGSLFDLAWNEYAGFIVRYDGKRLLRVPPVGMPAKFHGSYAEKECMEIAQNEADVIITNPPFSKFEHFYKCMISTGKEIICIGNGGAVQYSWTKELWQKKKIAVLPCEFHWFLGPSFKKKRAFAYVFTNVPQNIRSDKIKALADIPNHYFDEKSMLVVDNFVPNDYYKPFAISVSPIKNGILNSGYKLLQCSYRPVIENKYKFKRTIIIKELDENGKPNTAYDNEVFKEAKPMRTKDTQNTKQGKLEL
ncbi:MAG: adenine-specific methyltransferase EcoRI family protein [Bacteroidales bacterium]|nr:adenine-specific methyltransferase EcoRI family protein [Bacteroidales bacterium]